MVSYTSNVMTSFKSFKIIATSFSQRTQFFFFKNIPLVISYLKTLLAQYTVWLNSKRFSSLYIHHYSGLIITLTLFARVAKTLSGGG